jgi:hypothetical protein
MDIENIFRLKEKQQIENFGNMDLCSPLSTTINNVINPINNIESQIGSVLNDALSNIRNGIINAGGGIDDALISTINGINKGIDGVNNAQSSINKFISLFNIFSGTSIIDFIKSIISLVLLNTLPVAEFENITIYVAYIFFVLIFIFIISPILCLILLFL